MKREIRYGRAGLRRRPLVALLCWSALEAVPAGVSGITVARAVDRGFLAGRPVIGLAWLGLMLAAAGVGAVGSRQVYRCLGDLVEPFRDGLVRRVVTGALHRGVAGGRDDGAIARLSRQVEIVRDTYAGLIVMLNGFLVTVVGVVMGLVSIDPLIVALLLPPFLLGLALFLGTLGVAAGRQRDAVLADEEVAAVADTVIAGIRDVVATGAEEYAAAMAAGPIQRQAAAERALAKVAALRTLCFAVGGWGPLVVLLATAPWLVRQGLTPGGIMGGLTYVLVGLQPSLRNVYAGLGNAGIRFVITLGRILDATAVTPVAGPVRPASATGYDLTLQNVTFAYGPHAEPVLHDLDLAVPAGDHLAIIGPSGIGKSTLAGLLCGLLRPDAGTVCLGGTPAADLPPDELVRARVLIPQEAYVFSGTVWDNLTYLRPEASGVEVERAIAAVGAGALVERLGGIGAEVVPGRLSAGERQLLALVRAYVSAAPVAVLDEATSFLDPTAERQAEEAFAERHGTLIVIAHRMSSALRARRILVIDGTSATVGDHLTLQLTSPLYQDLLGHWDSRPSIPAGHRLPPIP